MESEQRRKKSGEIATDFVGKLFSDNLSPRNCEHKSKRHDNMRQLQRNDNQLNEMSKSAHITAENAGKLGMLRLYAFVISCIFFC